MLTFKEFQSKVEEENLKYGSCRGYPYHKETFNKIKIQDRTDYSEDFFKEFFGRQWRMRIKRMKDVAKFLLKQNEEEPVMMSVKQFGKKNAKVLETERVINDLLDLEVLRLFNAKYDTSSHRARIFKLNYRNLLLLKSFIPKIGEDKNSGVNLYTNNNNNTINNVYELNKLNNNVEEEECNEIESNESTTPELETIKNRVKELVKEQNTFEKEPLFQYQFPKDCMRAYSNFCFQPTLKKDHKIEHDQYRENILESKFPSVILEERDRIASIHNLNRFLKTGVLAGNNRETEDFYKFFAGKDLTDEERDSYKLLMMTFYFSSQQKWNSLVRHVIDYFYKGDSKAHQIAKLGLDRFKAAWKLLGCKEFSCTDELEEALRNFYRENRARLQEVEGELIGKDIFLYENVQNLSTEIELRKLGYTVETVYDGFYTNAPEEVWWKVYKEKLFELKTLIGSVKEI